MTTTIEFLGQASVVIEASGLRLATDPWMYRPACVMATLPWPRLNDTERSQALATLETCHYVYISHDHEDHFDPWLLMRLSPKTLLVGDFANLRFRGELEALAERHEIRYLADGETVQLADGFEVRMLLEKPLYRVNSVLLVRTPQGLVINANDCGLEERMIDEIAGWRRIGERSIFMYTLNLLASGWFFPYCRQGDVEVVERYLRVKDDVIANWGRLIKRIAPSLSVAYAGPLSMVDAVNSYINALPYARDNSDLVEQIQEYGPIVWPAPFSKIRLSQVGPSVELADWRRFKTRPLLAEKEQADVTYAAPIPSDELLLAANRFQSDLIEIQSQLKL